MSTPDHAENTGDNLRHAAEVQEKAQAEDGETELPSSAQGAETPLPDFNS